MISSSVCIFKEVERAKKKKKIKLSIVKLPAFKQINSAKVLLSLRVKYLKEKVRKRKKGKILFRQCS
jgi:ribosomal protein L35AE/L33A